MSFHQELWRRLATSSLSIATAGFAASCAQPAAMQSYDEPSVAVTQQAQVTDQACGLSCPAEGIAEGNASISGIASIDAFFQSALDFQSKANSVGAGIDAELQAIRGDFGIDADAEIGKALQAQINQHVQGELIIEAEPAKCAVDARASLQAQAKCDVSVDPGKATVACKGRCEVEASAEVECGAQAELRCTMTSPSVACSGECTGSCDVDLSAAARCEGTCTGECSGDCSAYAKNGDGELECAGTCSGMCEGSCKTEVSAEANCMGRCEGECTVTKPSGSCEGGIRAECQATGDASVECTGRCEGEFEPPKASAECEANARAQAKLNVECTPPRLAVRYALKLDLNAAALLDRPRFVAAMKSLELRLPALLAAIKRAQSVQAAGAELSNDGRVAVRGAVMTALSGEGSLRVKAGLRCAAAELDEVKEALESSVARIKSSIDASAELTAALKVTQE